MDLLLYEAAKEGDVKFLVKRYEAGNYFFPHKIRSFSSRNLLHVACSNGRLEFVKEVLKRLPIQLVCQTDKQGGDNPLHCAARKGYLDIVELLVDAYKKSSTCDITSNTNNNNPANNPTYHHDWIIRAIESEGGVLSFPPWRAINRSDRTPVHEAAHYGQEQVIIFLLEQEPNFLSSVDDNNSSSLLRDAASGGCKHITNRILTSDVAYSTAKFNLNDIMKLATRCSENDVVLLLEKHPELVECYRGTEIASRNNYATEQDPKRKTILHSASEHNLVKVIEIVLKINSTIARIVDRKDRNPLHVAAERGRFEVAQLLIDAFNKSANDTREQQQRGTEEEVAEDSPLITRAMAENDALPTHSSLRPPWRDVDTYGFTPLHLALEQRHTSIATLILSSELDYLCKTANECNHRSPSIITKVANTDMLDVQNRFMNIYLEVFHGFLAKKFTSDSKDAAKELIKQYPELTRYKDGSGRKILQFSLDMDDVDTMSFILMIDPLALDIQQDDAQEHLLIRACRKGNMPAVKAICRICPTAARHRIPEDQTTALHHVGQMSGGDARAAYKELLDIPQIGDIKDETDKNGISPLMKAIQDNRLPLAKALVRAKCSLTAKNNEGKTAADMLKIKSEGSSEWKKLYEEASANAKSHVPPGTDLKEMRSTLSIVAALIATITFAAAFTVPGGFDQESGDVILGQKASFMAFLLSDTYAMCCSMIVLYSLIWATYQDSETDLKSIDRSVIVLHHSLYGTMGAFMSGVYTMMSSKSIWVTIVILFMCSTVVIFAYILINFRSVRKLVRTVKTWGKAKREDDPELGET